MRRALIDWDHAAQGIWLIGSPDDGPPAPNESHRSQWSGALRADAVQPLRPWSELLTVALLDRLQRWNDWGCSLTKSHFDPQDWDTFYRDGRQLAETTQVEFGEHWQVLWASDGAWHFVRFP